MVVQTDLPHNHVRSNSLEICRRHHGCGVSGARRRRAERSERIKEDLALGLKPAGFDLFDVSKPEAAEADLAFRRGRAAFAGRPLPVVRRWRVRAHQLGRAGLPSRAIPRTTRSTTSSTCATRPSRWKSGAGGIRVPREGDAEEPVAAPPEVRRRLPSAQHDDLSGAAGPRLPRLHRRRGASSSTSATRRIRRRSRKFRYSPPMNGMTHTVMPLLERNLLVDLRRMQQGRRRRLAEARVDRERADETNLVPISTLPLPDIEVFGKRGGRFGCAQPARELSCEILVALGPDRRRRVLQRRRARLRHLESISAARDRVLRSRRAQALAQGRDPDQRRVRGRPAASCMRSTASAAGCTSSRCHLI